MLQISTAIAALLASVLLTALVRRFALAFGLLDVPNERSSHAAPVPRAGGLSIVFVSVASLLLLWSCNAVPRDLFLALLGGGCAVAAIGFFDDRHRLSTGVRFAVHAGAALWALVWLGGLPVLHLGAVAISLGPAGYVFGLAGLVWTLNLFNFMDGIDGIAASEAAFILFAGGALALQANPASAVPPIAFATGAASLGFLVWNWPPARIFMGDIGSGYLGFAIGALAVAADRESPGSLLVWLILGALFFIDATVTLVIRLLRRQSALRAHRTHAYQWLSRRWGSHRRVTVTVLTVNVLWLLPLAGYASARPEHAPLVACVALAPLVVLALLAGAGRPEAD